MRSGRAGLLFWGFVALLFFASPGWAINNCFDYVAYRLKGNCQEATDPSGNPFNMSDYNAILVVFQALNYTPASPPPKRDFAHMLPEEVERYLKPGDVIVINKTHVAIVNERGTIDHYLQVFEGPSKSRTFRPNNLPPPTKNPEGTFGGLFKGDSYELLLAHRKGLPPASWVEIWKRGPGSPYRDCPDPKDYLGAFTLTCPGAVIADCEAQVPKPDLKAIENQIRHNLGPPVSVVDVKFKDVDNGGSGRAKDPKIITRTYHATIFCEKETSRSASGLVACLTRECTQMITIENKKSHKIEDLPQISVKCEGDIPSPKPGYREVATDACGNRVELRHVADVVVSGKGCRGNPMIKKRIFEATDASGNSSQITQVIRVENPTPPTIVSRPPDLRLQQVQAIPAPDARSVRVEDACSRELLKVAWLQDQIVKPGSGRYGDPLVKKRIFRASDPCGNFLDVAQIIRVEEEPPAATTAGSFSGMWVSQASELTGLRIEQNGADAKVTDMVRGCAGYNKDGSWIYTRWNALTTGVQGKIKGNVLTLSKNRDGKWRTFTLLSPGRLGQDNFDANGHRSSLAVMDRKALLWDKAGQ